MVESILLQSGLEVSAKFKGAFCEARIKSVEPNVKCKVRFSDGKTIETPHKNLTLMGNTDKIAHGSKVSFHGKIGVIIRLKDVSVYTVVFDDGDEKTLKRGSLCIKGQRHFDESVTLDSLPLTDPEHFGNNVQAKDMFNSNIFTTDDTTTDNEDETDQSGSSVEIKVEKKPSPEPQRAKTPTPPPPPPVPVVVAPPPSPEKTKFEIMEQLKKEYTLNQNELADADGPDERINMIGIHMIFLSNKYQQFKNELVQIDRIRKKRKLKQEKENAKEMKPNC